MPKKIRELLASLKKAGFKEKPGGKGSHRKLVHQSYDGVFVLSGNPGADALRYQERDVKRVINIVNNEDE